MKDALKLKKAYQEVLNRLEYPHCSNCGTTSARIDFSHIIPRSRCRTLGKKELIFDSNNILLECRACHEVWENSNWVERSKMNNFEKKIKYIEIHDEAKFKECVQNLP